MIKMLNTYEEWDHVTSDIIEYMQHAYKSAESVGRLLYAFALFGTDIVGDEPIASALRRLRSTGLAALRPAPTPKAIKEALHESAGVRPIYLANLDKQLGNRDVVFAIYEVLESPTPLFVSTKRTFNDLHQKWTPFQREILGHLFDVIRPARLSSDLELAWQYTAQRVICHDLARVVYPAKGRAQAASLSNRQRALDDFTRHAKQFESPSPKIYTRLVWLRTLIDDDRYYRRELDAMLVKENPIWEQPSPSLISLRVGKTYPVDEDGRIRPLRLPGVIYASAPTTGRANTQLSPLKPAKRTRATSRTVKQEVAQDGEA